MNRLRTTLLGAFLAVALGFGLTFAANASAKITPPQEFCVNGGGQQPGGQQPSCNGGGLTQVEEPAKNPAGKAPPGQN